MPDILCTVNNISFLEIKERYHSNQKKSIKTNMTMKGNTEKNQPCYHQFKHMNTRQLTSKLFKSLQKMTSLFKDSFQEELKLNQLMYPNLIATKN